MKTPSGRSCHIFGTGSGDRSRLDRRLNESLSSYSETIRSSRKAPVEGKPYLIDAQVARKGVAWADKPWTPPIQVAALR
jgi:hypothetical protein